jgi:hypothetical protein
MNADMQKMLDELLNSPGIPPDVRAAVAAAMADPAKLDDALEKLKAIGANESGNPPLDIAAFYQPGPGNYALRWPLELNAPLPMPFEDLDRKTQFFVLFGEWTRRELEGSMLLNGGDLAGAETVFAECLERAKEIAVSELQARSCEGFMRVAQRRGDADAERAWRRKAAAARQT